MAESFQSMQEEYLSKLSDVCLGSELVFTPNKWKKGVNGKQREPADLAWACHDCLVLIYMQQKKRYDDVDKNHQAFLKAAKHNIGQAVGAVKRWRSGAPITGRKGGFEFSVAAPNIKHLVVLSVVSCGTNVGCLHSMEAKAMGASLAATVSQSFLMHLATAGGGIVDIIQAIMDFGESGEIIGDWPAAFYCSAHRYASRAVEKSGTGRFFAPGDLNDASEILVRLRDASRHDQIVKDDAPQTHVHHRYFFNDYELSDLYRMAGHIHAGVASVAVQNGKYLRAVQVTCRLRHYDVPMLIGPLRGTPESQDAMFNFAIGVDKQMREGALRPGAPAIIVNSDSLACVFIMHGHRPKTTLLREILDTHCSGRSVSA